MPLQTLERRPHGSARTDLRRPAGLEPVPPGAGGMGRLTGFGGGAASQAARTSLGQWTPRKTRLVPTPAPAGSGMRSLEIPRTASSDCPLYERCPRWHGQPDDRAASFLETAAQTERRQSSWPCSRLLDLLGPGVTRIGLDHYPGLPRPRNAPMPATPGHRHGGSGGCRGCDPRGPAAAPPAGRVIGPHSGGHPPKTLPLRNAAARRQAVISAPRLS